MWNLLLYLSFYKRSENDHILLSEKETQNQIRRYSDNDSPYLLPKYTGENSTI